MNLDKSLAFYKDRFADASDFTFVFVGSFDLPTIKPLVERYLGSLPAIHRKETWQDVGMRPPTGVVEKTVEKGIEPKSQAAIVFTGPFEYNAMSSAWSLRAMADDAREPAARDAARGSRRHLRRQRRADYEKIPREQYRDDDQLWIESSPRGRAGRRGAQTDRRSAGDGPTAKQLADVKETLLRNLETQSKTNSFLLTNISTRYEYGEDVGTLFDLADYYNRLATAYPRRRTHLSEHRELRARGAVSREELTAQSAVGFIGRAFHM